MSAKHSSARYSWVLNKVHEMLQFSIISLHLHVRYESLEGLVVFWVLNKVHENVAILHHFPQHPSKIC